MSVSADVATQIAATVGSLTLGTNIFAGHERPADDEGFLPHQAVFVFASGGLNDEPFIDGGAGGGISFPNVNIRVRSNKDEYETGEALAVEVFNAIDKNPPAGYFEARSLNSHPFYFGEDDLGHHIWGFTAQLRKCS